MLSPRSDDGFSGPSSALESLRTASEFDPKKGDSYFTADELNLDSTSGEFEDANQDIPHSSDNNLETACNRSFSAHSTDYKVRSIEPISTASEYAKRTDIYSETGFEQGTVKAPRSSHSEEDTYATPKTPIKDPTLPGAPESIKESSFPTVYESFDTDGSDSRRMTYTLSQEITVISKPDSDQSRKSSVVDPSLYKDRVSSGGSPRSHEVADLPGPGSIASSASIMRTPGSTSENLDPIRSRNIDKDPTSRGSRIPPESQTAQGYPSYYSLDSRTPLHPRDPNSPSLYQGLDTTGRDWLRNDEGGFYDTVNSRWGNWSDSQSIPQRPESRRSKYDLEPENEKNDCHLSSAGPAFSLHPSGRVVGEDPSSSLVRTPSQLSTIDQSSRSARSPSERNSHDPSSGNVRTPSQTTPGDMSSGNVRTPSQTTPGDPSSGNVRTPSQTTPGDPSSRSARAPSYTTPGDPSSRNVRTPSQTTHGDPSSRNVHTPHGTSGHPSSGDPSCSHIRTPSELEADELRSPSYQSLDSVGNFPGEQSKDDETIYSDEDDEFQDTMGSEFGPVNEEDIEKMPFVRQPLEDRGSVSTSFASTDPDAKSTSGASVGPDSAESSFEYEDFEPEPHSGPKLNQTDLKPAGSSHADESELVYEDPNQYNIKAQRLIQYENDSEPDGNFSNYEMSESKITPRDDGTYDVEPLREPYQQVYHGPVAELEEIWTLAEVENEDDSSLPSVMARADDSGVPYLHAAGQGVSIEMSSDVSQPVVDSKSFSRNNYPSDNRTASLDSARQQDRSEGKGPSRSIEVATTPPKMPKIPPNALDNSPHLLSYDSPFGTEDEVKYSRSPRKSSVPSGQRPSNAIYEMEEMKSDEDLVTEVTTRTSVTRETVIERIKDDVRPDDSDDMSSRHPTEGIYPATKDPTRSQTASRPPGSHEGQPYGPSSHGHDPESLYDDPYSLKDGGPNSEDVSPHGPASTISDPYDPGSRKSGTQGPDPKSSKDGVPYPGSQEGKPYGPESKKSGPISSASRNSGPFGVHKPVRLSRDGSDLGPPSKEDVDGPHSTPKDTPRENQRHFSADFLKSLPFIFMSMEDMQKWPELLKAKRKIKTTKHLKTLQRITFHEDIKVDSCYLGDSQLRNYVLGFIGHRSLKQALMNKGAGDISSIVPYIDKDTLNNQLVSILQRAEKLAKNFNQHVRNYERTLQRLSSSDILDSKSWNQNSSFNRGASKPKGKVQSVAPRRYGAPKVQSRSPKVPGRFSANPTQSQAKRNFSRQNYMRAPYNKGSTYFQRASKKKQSDGGTLSRKTSATYQEPTRYGNFSRKTSSRLSAKNTDLSIDYETPAGVSIDLSDVKRDSPEQPVFLKLEKDEAAANLESIRFMQKNYATENFQKRFLSPRSYVSEKLSENTSLHAVSESFSMSPRRDNAEANDAELKFQAFKYFIRALFSRLYGPHAKLTQQRLRKLWKTNRRSTTTDATQQNKGNTKQIIEDLLHIQIHADIYDVFWESLGLRNDGTLDMTSYLERVRDWGMILAEDDQYRHFVSALVKQLKSNNFYENQQVFSSQEISLDEVTEFLSDLAGVLVSPAQVKQFLASVNYDPNGPYSQDSIIASIADKFQNMLEKSSQDGIYEMAQNKMQRQNQQQQIPQDVY